MFAGPWEILILLVVVLLLFGKRLPSVMGSLGRSIVEFKKGLRGDAASANSEQERPHLNAAGGMAGTGADRDGSSEDEGR